jgi:hypothetical protein
VFTTPHDAARILVAKFGARGFTLIEQREADGELLLVLAGNRDVSGLHTIGSIFYVRIHGAGDHSLVYFVGKPTYDHVESCPSINRDPCRSILADSQWGLTGYEEKQVIRGVIAEIEIDSPTS